LSSLGSVWRAGRLRGILNTSVSVPPSLQSPLTHAAKNIMIDHPLWRDRSSPGEPLMGCMVSYPLRVL